jgi:hypothetical protein
MNLPFRKNPWPLMLAVNVAMLTGVFLNTIVMQPYLYLPYIHLLVDYHFGFTKRALIGAVVSLFTDKIPVWLVFALGGGVWLITAVLFIWLFRRTFGVGRKRIPLFLLMAGSPFFLKNFMHSLGYFDIYGCAVALCLLLAPARSIIFVIFSAIAAAILILIHHIHFFMYVPTIALIVVIRYYLIQGLTRWNAFVGTVAVLALFILLLAAQFYGKMSVPPAEFVSYLQSRIADASREDLPHFTHAFAYVWYQPLSQDILDTWARVTSNIACYPVFALLIWLHRPLWRYFHDLIRALSSDWHRHLVILGIILVTAAYVVIFALAFDYSRWISNWSVCLFLILHAVKTLPASHDVSPIPTEDSRTQAFSWIITCIPRIGIVRPW